MRPLLVLALLAVGCSRSITADPSAGDASSRPQDEVNQPSPGPSPTSTSQPSTPGDDTQISGSRLKRRVLKGSDGSQQFAGWFDSERNEVCDFRLAIDGKTRCLPATAFAAVGYFSDNQCTQPVVVTTKGCAPSGGGYAQITLANSCGTLGAARMFAVTTPFTNSTVYYKSSTDCVIANPANAFVNADAFNVGPEIPASSFVEAVEDKL